MALASLGALDHWGHSRRCSNTAARRSRHSRFQGHNYFGLSRILPRSPVVAHAVVGVIARVLAAVAGDDGGGGGGSFRAATVALARWVDGGAGEVGGLK